MPPLQVAPYRDIAHDIAVRLVTGRGSSDPLAPWLEEVIVPSRGVASAIASELLALRPEGVAGLRIQTIDELAGRLLETGGRPRRVASDAERRLAMRTALRSSAHPMLESRGVASMLERAYRDVRDGGLTLGDLSKRARNTRLRNPERTTAILNAWSEYERLIAALDATDAADRLAAATKLVSKSLPPQLLAGFYDMTGAQLAFVEALLDADRLAAIWVPTDAPFAQPLIRTLGRRCGIVPNEKPGAASAATSTSYDTRFNELRGVCHEIASLLAGGTPPGEIAIVARSLEPYDVRLLNRFASECGFRTTLPDERPLLAHRIGRGAVTLLRLRERGFPRAEVLELVRDGLHTKKRIAVDAVDAATRRARLAGGTSAELSALESRPREIADYVELVAELEELTSRIDLDLFRRLGSMFRIETDLDLAAAEKLDAIGEMFRRTLAWQRDVEVSAMIDAIEQESIADPRASAEGPTIWAGELLRFRGRSVRHLFVVRMQDDVFPQRRSEDPLLPDPDRKKLGLRTIGDGREEEALLFSLLADASPEVRHSFAVGDGFGKVLRPSRYLRGIAGVPPRLVGPTRPPASNHPRQLQLVARSGTRSAFDGYLGALDGRLREKLRSLSPTQLEDFGECPQKFFLKHLLGVRDIDDPERELQINPREKGSADHRVLERFYRAASDADLDRASAERRRLPPDLRERLETFVDEEFDRLERELPPFNRTVREIERRATRRLLAEFLVRDIADLETEGLRPRWFEYKFGEKHADRADHPAPFMVRAGEVEVRVEGTVDRIDVGDSRYRIVDYKSGKAARHENLGDKIDRGVRLQLALYSMAVAEFFSAPAENISATIKPLAETPTKPEKFAFALHEKRETLLETLQIFMRAILAGSFPAFPNENNSEFNSCKYCPVNHSCRTRHDAAERYAVTRHKDPRTLLASGENA